MRNVLALAALFVGLLVSPAFAQSTAQPVLPGMLVTSGCPPGYTSCYVPYSNANPLPVTGGGGSGASSGGIGASTFIPNGNPVTQTVDSTGETFTITAGSSARIAQTGVIKNVYCSPGGSASSTTSPDFPVAVDYLHYAGTTITCKTVGSDTSVVQITPGSTVLDSALPLLGQSAEPAAVTTGNTVAAWADLYGKLVLSNGAPRDLWTYGKATSTDTAAHTMVAALGSGIRYIPTDLSCNRTDTGTAAITVTFNDVNATVWSIPANGGGGAHDAHYQTPLKTAPNTAFTFTVGPSGVTSVICNSNGFPAAGN